MLNEIKIHEYITIRKGERKQALLYTISYISIISGDTFAIGNTCYKKTVDIQ